MRIGYATQNPTSHYWLLVNYGVRERAIELGIDVSTTHAYTLEQQIAAIDDFIAQGVDVLLLGPTVATGLAGAVERVRTAGIPVIVLAAQLSDCRVDCTVRSDHLKGAELAAAYLVEQIGGAGEVVHLIGPSRLQDNIDRAQGVRNVLGRHPGVQIVFEQESPDWYPESAAAMMHEALERFPNLRGVCIANDTLAMGALTAIEAQGRTGQIVVTGFDATPDALIAIHEGRMSATVRQSMRTIGAIAVDMAQRVAAGEVLPPLVLVEIALVTRANLLETALDTVYFLPTVLNDVVVQSEALAHAYDLNAIAEREEAAEALHASDERFRRMAEATFEGIVLSDAGKVLDVNQNWVQMFGYTADEIRNVDGVIMAAPEARALVRQHIITNNEQPYEIIGLRKDGTRFPIEVRDKMIQFGERSLRVTAFQDITERKQAEAEREDLLGQVRHALARTDVLYRTAQALIAVTDLPELLQTVVDQIVAGLPADRATVITFDLVRREVGQFVKAGPGAAAIVAVGFDELWSGLSGLVLRERHAALSPRGTNDPRESPEAQQRRLETAAGAIMVVPLLYRGQILGTVTAINRPDQVDFDAGDLALLEAMANQAAAAIANAQLVSEVQQRAITDDLTQLLNRRGFFTIGKREFVRAHRQHECIAVLMLDIDYFKQVNDRHGHACGDQVLQEVAQRCRENTREVDVLGRYGGEEFVIVLSNVSYGPARMVAERLRAYVAATPVETTTGPIPVTISIGIALLDDVTATLEALVQRADGALYNAKRNGRNRVEVDEVER